MKYTPKSKHDARVGSSLISEDNNVKSSVVEPDKLEVFFEKKSDIFLYIVTGLSFLMSVLLFNPDVSVGGDDSTYLDSAYKFAEGLAFPTWQGPFYPMFLAIFYKVFGFHTILFKILSVLFFSASVFFSYKLFAKYANYKVAVFTSVLSSVSLMLLTYASTTYTEPMFMFFQVLLLYLVLTVNEREDGWQLLEARLYWRKTFCAYFALALLSYVMFQTRSIAIVIIPALLAYLMLLKKFKPSFVYAVGVVVCHLVNTIYRRVVWGAASVSFTGQLDSILLVNPYKANLGYETFGGFVQRFLDNSSLYLSKHLMRMFGFIGYDSFDYSLGWAIVILVILILLGVCIWMKNRKLFAVYGYVAMMVGVTFVMLQKIWDQERLIMIYFPFILGMLFYVLSFRPWIMKMFALVLMLTIGGQTLAKGNFDVSDNFDSCSYSSYTDDWRNYMSASKWASDNLPEGSVVICRKSQMSWMASEGSNNVKFQGLYKLYCQNPDSMRSYLLDTLKGTHVIMANLRLNPYLLNGQTITTVRYSLRNLTLKYPFSLKLVKKFGTKEPAYLFEFTDYTKIDFDNLFNSVIVEPENTFAWRQLVAMCLNDYDYDKALSLAEQGLGYCGDDPDLLFFEGVVYNQKKDYNKSLEKFDLSIKGAPNNGDTYINKAISLIQLGRYQEAKSAYALGLQNGVDRSLCMELESELRKH